MTYADATAWMDQFANLERRPDPSRWSQVKLERVEDLLAELGDPHLGPRTVHIAGSKGKGSVAAMVDSMLRAAGRRTGLYTSPHLVSERERIQVSGRPIAEEALAELVASRLKPAAEARAAAGETELSWFDLHTALAFAWFAAAGTQWNVIEVGLGGRLDATNVVQPELCAITAISLEHTQFLGHSLTAIAGEKAGIVKPGVPLVLAPQPAEAERAIRRRSDEVGAPVIAAHGVAEVVREPVDLPDGRLGQELRVRFNGNDAVVRLPLVGAHQRDNAAVAVALAELAGLELAAVVSGLEQTHWPGRFQVVARRPWVILDGAHNPASAAALVRAVDLLPHRRAVALLGSSRDKDVAGFVAELGTRFTGLVACGVPDNPRSMAPDELAAHLEGRAERVATAASIDLGLELARSWCSDDDLILVTGSLYLVGAALRLWRGDAPA